MADNHTIIERSYKMSCIRSTDTKPEETVRKYLFSCGLRYRKNDKRYPGKPDLVFPKYHAIVFVNGCFWHSHEGCSEFIMPKSRLDYWQPKLERNHLRDIEHVRELEQLGWNVITVWECELKKAVRDERLAKLFSQITGA
ncbi:MAG: very short patch repair endonuclease [Anaerofustis sp.]